MNYSDRLALIREYKSQGGKGSYLSLLSEAKQYPKGGTLPVIDNAAYFRTQQPAQQAMNPQVFNVNTSPQVVRADNTVYQPKFDKNYEWPEFGGNLEGVTISPSDTPYRDDVQSRREDIQTVPITKSTMKQFPQATQREFMKQQVADRPDYEAVADFANLAATGFGLAPMGIIDDVVRGAIGVGGKYIPKVINKAADILEPIGSKIAPNAHKINPWAFKPTSEAYYRGIGRSGFDDAIETGTLRTANKTGNYGEDLYVTKDMKVASGNYSRDQAYGVGNVFDDDWKMVQPKDTKSYMAEIPEKDLTNLFTPNDGTATTANPFNIAYNRGAVPIDNINFYKENWLQGYKKLPKANKKK